MKIDPGQLRERVRLEKRSGADDGFGNTEAGFTPQFERWAAYLMKPGSEAVLAARLTGQQPVTIVVRFDSGTRQIAPDWRVVDVRTGTIYAIQAVEDMDRQRQWISIVALAGATA